MAKQLKKCRAELLKIDAHIIALLEQRMSISEEIGKIKFASNLKIRQSSFWKEACRVRFDIAIEKKMETAFIEKIFIEIQNESKKVQREVFKKIKREIDIYALPKSNKKKIFVTYGKNKNGVDGSCGLL